jgi:hypothetical protein
MVNLREQVDMPKRTRGGHVGRPPGPPPAERILARTTVQNNGCWTCSLGLTGNGYAMIRIGSRTDGTSRRVPVHRFMYELLVGPIPQGLDLDHVKERGCTSRACWNPEHLEPVTNLENILRGESYQARNARKTHCKRGHPYDEANTRRRPDGGRDCRTCRREVYNPRQRRKVAREEGGTSHTAADQMVLPELPG